MLGKFSGRRGGIWKSAGTREKAFLRTIQIRLRHPDILAFPGRANFLISGLKYVVLRGLFLSYFYYTWSIETFFQTGFQCFYGVG
jgi:hypothetical protein